MKQRYPLLATALLLSVGSSANGHTPGDDALVATGTIDASGFHGTWQSTIDPLKGRFATRSDLGPYKVADVYDGVSRWHVEPSGGSHLLNSEFAARAARTEAWLATFGWSKLKLRRRTGVEGIGYTPPKGSLVRLWFDRAGNLARAVQQTWYQTRETLYSDYRLVGRSSLPFRIVSKEGSNEERVTISQYEPVVGGLRRAFLPPSQPNDNFVPNGGTTVPIEFFPQLTVDAVMNGKRMTFVLDSGGHNILTPEAAKVLGLDAGGGSQSGGTGAGTLLQRHTNVTELRIGRALMRDQHFYVIPFPYGSMELGASPPAAGILGLEVFERFTVRINYRDGELTLMPRDTIVPCSGTWEPVRFTDDMPTITARLDGIPAPFTMDTGNNGTLFLYRHWMQQKGVASRYARGAETVTFGAGGPSHNWESYAKSFSIGAGPAIAKPRVRTTDDRAGVAMSVSEAGNLGTDLLANYTLTFDYSRSRVCVTYVPGYQSSPFNRSGMRATKEAPDHFRVMLVSGGSPAWVSGLREGDLISAVNGKTAQTMSGGDLSLALTQPPGSKVTIQYSRKGVAAVAIIVLKEILKRDDDTAAHRIHSEVSHRDRQPGSTSLRYPSQASA